MRAPVGLRDAAELIEEIALPKGPRWRRLVTANVLWILLIEVGLVVAFSAIQPNFLKPFNVRSIVADQSSSFQAMQQRMARMETFHQKMLERRGG